jgi:hypothetical protein
MKTQDVRTQTLTPEDVAKIILKHLGLSPEVARVNFQCGDVYKHNDPEPFNDLKCVEVRTVLNETESPL